MDQVPDFSLLSPRERDCLRLYADHTVKEVAGVLGISPDTVKTHLASARGKLDGMSGKSASRHLRASEAGHPIGTSLDRVIPISLLDAAPTALPGQSTGAALELVREDRIAFDLTNIPSANQKPEPRHGHSRPLEDSVLILLVVTLVLASIRYLPDLAARAQDLANYIDP